MTSRLNQNHTLNISMDRGPLTTDMPLLDWSCSSPPSAKTQMQCQLHGLITVLLYYFRNQEIPGNLFYVDTSKLLLELFWFFFLSFFFFRLKKNLFTTYANITSHPLAIQ